MRATSHVVRERYGLLALAIVLTLLVRLLYGLVVFDHIADSFSWRLNDEYSDLAYTIATSGKFAVSAASLPTMKRLPVYPLVLAGVYSLFGRSPVAVRIFQCLLSAVTCVVIYLTAREVTNERVAGIASLIFALYPNSILYSARALSETTYFLLLSVFCLTVVRYFKMPGVWTSATSGLSFGILMLTKSTAVLLPPFMFLILLSAHYRKRMWLVIFWVVSIVFVAALVLSPWVIRNHRLTGKIMLSTWGGTPFYRGYYLATHLWEGRSGLQLDQDAAEEARHLVHERYAPRGQPIDEYHQDRIAYLLVRDTIMARPLYSFWIFLRNVFLAWFLAYGRMTTILSFAVHALLLLPATYAISVMLRQDTRGWIRVLPLVLICTYFNLFHAVIYPHVRFMSPAIGTIVTILAAYGVSHLISPVSASPASYLGRNLEDAGSKQA